uniref:Putative septum site-determining protein n=1 Tax=Paulinella longichromatophora TaxID=1708747 RepID=A0A2H4ZQ22_9EUKA|nr:putative septum site-determining protein [Paulinella longichromatophora]
MPKLPVGSVILDSHNWALTLPVIKSLILRLRNRGILIDLWESERPEVRMIVSSLSIPVKGKQFHYREQDTIFSKIAEETIIHKGTLRAGDTLTIPATLLLLGDVNPGAIISSAGDVMIWGKLRGIAHAGYLGNRNARIIAMHLRPLQLRIAEVVARVPDDKPMIGLAEEAQIFEGNIRIIPAYPNWNNRL